MSTFYDARLPLSENFGINSSYQFKTTIQEVWDGRERRFVNWEGAIARFEISADLIIKGSSMHPSIPLSDLNSLISFHEAVQGRYLYFRVRDPVDYQATKDILNIFDNGAIVAFTQGVLSDNGDGSFQFHKKYGVVGDNGEIYEVFRPITRPSFSQVFDSSGVEVPGDDLGNGKFIPSAGVPFTWEGEFDVPVRFENDSISWKLEGAVSEDNEYLFSIDSISLIEVSEVAFSYIPSSFPDFINHSIRSDFLIGGSFSPSFSTLISKNDAGFERRDKTRDNSKLVFSSGEREDLNEEDIIYLLSLFRCSRGSAFAFYDDDSLGMVGSPFPARFDDDTLSISFNGFNPFTYPSFVFASSFSLRQVFSTGDSVYTKTRCWFIKSTPPIAVTCFNRPLFIDGVLYSPSGGFDPTELVSNNEASVDSMEFSSFFDIVELNSFANGSLQGVSFDRFVFDFNSLDSFYEILNGTLGKRSSSNRIFSIEGRSLSQKLQQKRIFQTSSLCWKIFGSQGPGLCNADISSFTFSGQIISVSDFSITASIPGSESFEDDFFAEGKIKFDSFSLDIRASSNSSGEWVITFWERPVALISDGVPFEIIAGCNKTRAHCQYKFDNFHNFGGEPSLPGNNQYIAGPLNSTNLDD